VLAVVCGQGRIETRQDNTWLLFLLLVAGTFTETTTACYTFFSRAS